MINIENCCRCGHDHSEVLFKMFTIPIYTPSGEILSDYWGVCPKLGEPIILCIEDEEEED